MRVCLDCLRRPLSANGRARRTLFAVLRPAVLAAGLFVPGVEPHAEPAAEYRLKAAFLGNFIAYTEWPESVGDAITLCVYGPDPFDEHLDRLKGKVVGRRSIALRHVSSTDGLGGCHVVFVATPVIGNLPRVIDSTSGKPVLIVADTPGAARRGAAINMVTEASKVGFEANVIAARNNGLTLSSNMLRLAVEVIK